VKVGGFEVIRKRAFAAAPSPPKGELGSDGDSWLSRYMGGGPDPNLVLSGTQKFDVYDEMALSDVHCKAVLQMVRICRSSVRSGTSRTHPTSRPTGS
jgi:hypothetical protein